ncbi:MAG TPA: hypothetical protein VME23_20435 [Terracidiphilus sp.]|nr:hypothetical protein [Terracidiphilus sp.]
MIPIGSKVHLRGARGVGAAGTVIRCEGSRLVVYWSDLDFVSRHKPESLEIASQTAASTAIGDARPTDTASASHSEQNIA